MRYAYYDKLNRRQQAIYRHSERLETFAIPAAADFAAPGAALRAALEAARAGPAGVGKAAGRLSAEVTDALGAPPLRVTIGKRRPGDDHSELHGLYEPAEDGDPARITVWMYTAHRHQVVKFRTFLRTLAHEMCHHLDYELLGLEESFHTAGFFKRESFLYQRLLSDDAPDAAARADRKIQ